MLNIQVNMHGNLRRFLPGGVTSAVVRASEGVTVGWVAEQIEAQSEIWLSAIDQTVVPLSTPLTRDVTLDFFSLLEGG